MAGPGELTNEHGADFHQLPLEVVQRIDELADEFESSWISGRAPLVDGYLERLTGASDEARQILESHLLALQQELSSRSSVTTDDAGRRQEETTEGVLRASPQRVGEYELQEQLGSGGMGVVYKARHGRLQRTVAIKFPRFISMLDGRSTARFLREARLIGQLDHPHIVRALDAGESPYGPYLVTEFIEGETIETRVRRLGPLPFKAAMEYGRQTASALMHAHDAHIVHRDIKPSNLLLDRQGLLRVVDFGLAKGLNERIADREGQPRHADHTESGAFLGTVAYAAPEQLHADQAVDHRADIYSLACAMYFMLTGEPPHPSNLADRLARRRRSRANFARLPTTEAPASFERVWRRMTAESPADRFASMAAVHEALEAAASGHGAGPRPALLSRRIVFGSIALAGLGGLALLNFNPSRNNGVPTAGLTVAPRGPSPPIAAAPFNSDQAQRHQTQWAEHLSLPRRLINKTGMPLVLLPPGEFAMGADEAELLEPAPPPGDWRYVAVDELRRQHQPRRRVTLTEPLFFGETEVTNEQFRAFVEATGYITDAEKTSGWGKEDKGWVKRAGYSWKNLGQRLCEDGYPVINVTWNDAVALADWLTTHDGRGRYRLPTEAEWEYACRAGTTTAYYFGDDPSQLDLYAWTGQNSDGRYRPVGMKSPNAFGLCDMYGNRQEWCLDHFAADYYSRSPAVDPLCEQKGIERAVRGGTHTDLASFCTSARRWKQEADNPGAAGIRLVLEIDYHPSSGER